MAKSGSKPAAKGGKKGDNGVSIWKWLEHNVATPVLMVFFSLLSLGMSYWGRPDTGTRAYSLVGNGFAWICAAVLLIWCVLTVKSRLSLGMLYRGRPDTGTRAYSLVGNGFAWICVAALLIWSILTVKLTTKTVRGPTTMHGFTPIYASNGVECFAVSVIVWVVIDRMVPSLSPAIYFNMPEIIAALNIVALAFCTYLHVKGKYSPECGEIMEPMPLPYEFYRGMEIHPTILGGVDVKQFVICRFCMLSWTILSLVFLSTRLQIDNGELNLGLAVNVAIQFIYSLKFFVWEVGFFDTFDMIYERAGYYLVYGSLVFVPIFYPFSSYWFVNNPPIVSTTSSLIIASLAGYYLVYGSLVFVPILYPFSSYWAGYYLVYGSLVFVPIFYPFSSYWFVNNPPVVSTTTSLIIFSICMIAIALQYRVDYEKEVVRSHKGKWSLYWKPVQVIDAKYQDAKGKERTSKLVISGLWGMARHMNYTCELIITFCIGAPGFGLGSLAPFSYFVFMFSLLIHRLYLDEKKCSEKYGRYWTEYCKRVPYRLIPYVI